MESVAGDNLSDPELTTSARETQLPPGLPQPAPIEAPEAAQLAPIPPVGQAAMDEDGSNVPTPQHPWDRQPGEPGKWYDRFDHYRLMGPARSQERLWKRSTDYVKGQRIPKQWFTIKTRWHWDERAEAWDEHERPARRKKMLAELAAIQRRKARVFRLMEARGREFLDQMLPAEHLDAKTANLYIKDAFEGQMAARVDPLTADLADLATKLEEIQARLTAANL